MFGFGNKKYDLECPCCTRIYNLTVKKADVEKLRTMDREESGVWKGVKVVDDTRTCEFCKAQWVIIWDEEDDRPRVNNKKLDEAMAKYDDQIDALEDQITELEGEIDDIEESEEEPTAAQQKEIAAKQKKIEQLTNRVEKITESRDDAEEKFDDRCSNWEDKWIDKQERMRR
jgi:uncharacterized coiled-coil protein SlyX